MTSAAGKAVSTPNNNRAWRWRSPLLLGVLLLVAVVLLARLTWLQLWHADFLIDQGEQRFVRERQLPVQRAVISDRNGRLLAISAPVEALWAEPAKVLEQPLKIAALATLLGRTEDDVQRQLKRQQHLSFAYLRRSMKPSEAQRVMALGIDGVHSRREYQRFYPAGEAASQLLGYTNIDEQGLEGLERAYDDWLSGDSGKVQVIRDRRGWAVEQIQQLADREPGQNLTLSIDLRLQYLVYRELKAAVHAHRAEKGSAVVLDVASGEILAVVNQPAFNPNNRQQRGQQDGRQRNQALTDVFEPGSTMKPFVVAAALEQGVISADSTFDTSPGRWRHAGKLVRDSRNYGLINVAQILAKSSNIGASMIGLKLTSEDYWQTLDVLGFGQYTAIGFPSETPGRLPHFSDWGTVTHMTLTYGYGLSANVVQLAQAYAVLGAGGLARPATLLRRAEKVVPRRVFSRNTALHVVGMLEGVVAGGTGTRAEVNNYRVAGKTGTVHKVGRRGYEDNRFVSVFAGLIPASQPRLAAVIVIDDPRGEYYQGGRVAAPVFARIMEPAMQLLGIAPDVEPQQPQIKALPLVQGVDADGGAA